MCGSRSMRERIRPHCRQFSRQQSYAERFQLQLPGVHRMRIHRSAARHRWDGQSGKELRMDPFQPALFLFCGRRRDRLKALYWERDGFLLLYKRLENGSFQWPRSTEEVQALTPQQYRWLLEELKTEQPKANKAVSGLSAV